MSEVDAALAIGLCFALAFSVGNRRAWAWLLAIAGSYVVSTIYWRSGLPYGGFMAGMCDAAVCLAVYFFGRLRWELWIYRLFQFSVAVNLVYLGVTLGLIADLRLHNAYSITLEAINWAALLFIGGIGALQAAGASDVAAAAHRPWSRVHRLVQALYRSRKSPPWHHIP